MLTELAVLIWEEVGSSTVLRCKLGWKVRSSHVRCKRPNSYLLTRMFPYSWMKWFLHRRHTYTIRTTLEHRAKIVVQKVTGIQSVDYVTDPSLHTSFQDSKMMWAGIHELLLCIHTAASLVSPGRSKKPTIYSLPTELICEIFLLLDAQGLRSVKLVCSHTYIHCIYTSNER